MSTGDLLGAVGIGLAAGVTSGMLGVGGGILFVPGLVFFLGLHQLGAESTSLLAIIPVALVGVPAIGGVVAGAALQQRVSVRIVAGVFAALLVVSAVLLVV